MTTPRSLLLLTTVLALAVLAPVAAVRAQGDVPVVEDPDNLSVEPVTYKSENGEFQVVFPGGCGKLITRANEPDLFGGEEWNEIVQVTYVFCDRFQSNGEGCSVNATFNLTGEDGGLAGPAEVTRRMGAVLNEYGVKVVNQKTIGKDFGDGVVAEGVDALARAKDLPGEVWIRGLLINGDVYILTAWKEDGRVWGDPAYVSFFNSFQPWTD